MWARTRFDISYGDIAFGVLRCLTSGDRSALQDSVERLWSPESDAIACYSVRSSLDLLLTSMDLPADSEILFSAINIKGMFKVVTRLGLQPVPVDVDFDCMAPRVDALEKAITPKAKVLVVAHLFGSRCNLDPILEIAHRHGIFVLEDCAQAYGGPSYTSHPKVDASAFSFGPLKTATALGGALIRVRDRELLGRMRENQRRYPVQRRQDYLVRLLKFAALKTFAYRIPFALLSRVFKLLSKLKKSKTTDLDSQLNEVVRGISRQGRASSKGLRYRPCDAMLALMIHRIEAWREGRLDARIQTARSLLTRIGEAVRCPGAKNESHVFWAFPVLVENPGAVIVAMRKAGFDAAPGVSLHVAAPPEDRPELKASIAEQTLAQIVYLPCYPAMDSGVVEKQADILLNAVLEPDGDRIPEPKPTLE